MEMLNHNPVRYLLSQTEKKGLFSKKEVSTFAVGDETGAPLTAYEFVRIEPYFDGFASAQRTKSGQKGGRVLLDLNGKVLLPEYKYHNICLTNGYLTLYRPTQNYSEEAVLRAVWREPDAPPPENDILYLERGLANRQQKVLIDPKKNHFLRIHGDIVLYGEWSPVSADYNKLGVGRLAGDELVPVLPCEYNHVEYVWDRIVAAGRYVVNKQSTPSSLTKNTVTVTQKLAFQLFDADSGKTVSDLVFGGIHRTDKGNIRAVVYPHILPEQLTHRQSVGEAFTGGGLLDFSDPKNVVLNERFEFPH